MMNLKQQFVAYHTIVKNEARRTLRIWSQTLLPPAITSILYFLIFGHVIGNRIGSFGGYPYIQFIAPGLIMMNIITSSYSSAVSVVFSSKFQRSIEEMLVSPMSNLTMLLGFITAGICRGLVVGVIVAALSMAFTHLQIYSMSAIVIAAILSSCIFSLAGVINGLFARNFDQISIIPTFVLTPLTYLGGVFYSISLLPKVWQYLSLVNPIVYIVENFRYGFLGISHSHIMVSYVVMIIFTLLLFSVTYYIILSGKGLRE